MDSKPASSTLPRRVTELFRGEWAPLLLALAVFACWLETKVSPYVGGSDSSGYYNTAKLLDRGDLRYDLRIVPGVPAGQDGVRPQLYQPLGFKVIDNTTAVPTYPFGLSLVTWFTAKLTGWFTAPAWVAGAHFLVVLGLVYLLARECGLPPAWAYLGLGVIAASPLCLAYGIQPMSDGPTMTWCTGAIYCALRGTRTSAAARWDIFAGFCFGFAVLMRPTAVLIGAPLVAALGVDLRRWGWFVLGAAPAAAALLALNALAYGSPFTTGYPDLRSEFGLEWFWPTWMHYAHWIPLIISPLVVFIFWVPFARLPRRLKILFAVWIVIVFGFYSTYSFTHLVWWYNRFILPAAPALVIGSLLALRDVWLRLDGARQIAPKAARAIALAIVVALAALDVGLVREFRILYQKKSDITYPDVAAWLDRHVPRNAVIAAMEMSGGLMAYGDFTFIRWETLEPAVFARMVQQLQRNGQPLYATLIAAEVQPALDHMPGSWHRIATVREASIWQYEFPHPAPVKP